MADSFVNEFIEDDYAESEEHLAAVRRVIASDVDGMFQVGDMLDFGVLMVDAELRIVRSNQWLEVASGLTAADLAGQPIGAAFCAIAGTARENSFGRAVAGETVVLSHRLHEYLLPLPCPPGIANVEWMQQNARIVPVRMSTGAMGAVAFIQDMTERVVREEELRAATEAADAASRAKSEFLAAMSHELRTPLTAVIGYAGLLTQEIGGKLSLAHMQHAERIASSAWHLIGIIDQVLTFSRAEAGREELLVEEIDVCEMARHALMLVETQAAAKGVEVGFDADCDAILFHTDALRIEQILINLLSNAVKFTDSGRIDLTVGVEGGDLVIRVRDNGPGVSAENHERIFEAFTQVNQTGNRTKGGTGLGLPVSRKLAELMGGTLKLESSDASGCTFCLRLPARRE
ncbi:MAG: ATP-binding protein [Longimicrobiales bacterium]